LVLGVAAIAEGSITSDLGSPLTISALTGTTAIVPNTPVDNNHRPKLFEIIPKHLNNHLEQALIASANKNNYQVA
jgi:hypothetical protein